MTKTKDFTVTSWGTSMYGGWYVDYINNGTRSGVNGRTLKECLVRLGITRIVVNDCIEAGKV